MAITKLQIAAGLDREGTSYSAEGRWFDGDKIRFRSGKAEKIGGWQRLSDNTFLGVARSLINWTSLDGDNYVGIGTNLKYYIEDGGAYVDITPIRKTVDPMPGASGTGSPIQTARDSLASDITATQINILLVDASSFPVNGGLIKIDDEQIEYTSVNGNTLEGCVRGTNDTTATTHTATTLVACATIKVTDPNHEALSGDFVTFSGLNGFAGITTDQLNQEHQIRSIIDSLSYTITIPGAFATSPATGGGAVGVAEYQVNTGLDTYVVGLGFGSDPWGSGGWGSAGSVGIGQQLRLWASANYGEDLLFNPRQGPIYYWDATTGTSDRGVLLNDLSTAEGFSGQFVPHTTNLVIATPTERFVMALGANPYDPSDANTDFDPLRVRWSDQENPYQWVPAITNQAGGFRLSHGSYIVGASSTRQEVLIFTDSALYSAQYVGPPYVWGFNIMAENISVISPNAMITANNITYWMGVDKFYAYSGRVQTLPSALRQYIFSDINRAQTYQVFAGSNERYNEVWWFYCSRESTTVDKYVVYNYVENVWFYGSLSRSAWLDASTRENPLAADYQGKLIYHEVGTDDLSTADPQPIAAYIQSADFDIGDGDKFAFVWRILPDINFTGSTTDNPSVTMTLKPRRNAGAPYGDADQPTVTSQDDYRLTRAYTIQQFNGQVYTRLRGRQMALRVESSALGVAWQLGSVRADIRPDGGR